MNRQNQRRLDRCHAHSNCDRKNVFFFFTDESRLWVYPTSIKKWTKPTKHQSFSVQRNAPNVICGMGCSHGVGGWGEWRGGGTPLCLSDKNRTMDLFVDSLQGFLLPTAQVLYVNDWGLQQNNDPDICGRVHKTMASEQNRARVERPSKSDRKQLGTHGAAVVPKGNYRR